MADIERVFARREEASSSDPFGLIQPLQRVSLARKAEELIREAIVTGLLRSGEQISPQEIADRLGVSRTPVREAIIHLNAVGLVEMLPGRIQIASPTASAIQDAFMLRESLEGMAARLAAERRTADEARAIVKHARLSKQAAREKSRARFQRSDRDFHLAVGEASHSVQIARYLSYALDLAFTLRNLRVANTPFRASSVRHHVELAEAIERRDADAAEKISREHVQSVLAWVTDARSDREG